MKLARSKTVHQQLEQVLTGLAEINRLLVQFLANETQHNATHQMLETRLDKVENEIAALKEVKP